MHTLYQISQALGLVAFVALIWLVVRACKTHILWGLGILLLSPITATIYAIKYWEQAKQPFLVYISSLVAGTALGLIVFTSWGGWRVVQDAAHVHSGIERQSMTEADGLRFMHSSLDFLENASQTEQDQKTIAIMRKMLNQMTAGKSDTENREITREFLDHFENFDLDEQQRQGLERIRQQLENLDAQPAGEHQGRNHANNPEDWTLPKVVSVPLPSAPPSQSRLVYVPIPVARARDYLGFPVKVTGNTGPENLCKLVAVSRNGLHFEKRIRGGTMSFAYHYDAIKSLKVLKREVY